MADSVVEIIDAAAVEKDTVTSSVKASPVKESNGSVKKVASDEADDDKADDEAEVPKENGAGNGTAKKNDDAEEVKENGDHPADDVCAIKRKSCTGDVETPDVTTPEKKAKISEDDSPVVTEESNDAEAIEA